MFKLFPEEFVSTFDALIMLYRNKVRFIPIPLNYCPLVLVKIIHVCVALNPNNQLLLNQAPCPDLFSLRTTRSQT